MHTVGPLHPWILSRLPQILFFDLWLVESMYFKPRDMEDQLHIYHKKSAYKWTHTVQSRVVQESTVYNLRYILKHLLVKVVIESLGFVHKYTPPFTKAYNHQTLKCLRLPSQEKKKIQLFWPSLKKNTENYYCQRLILWTSINGIVVKHRTFDKAIALN